MDSGEFPDGRQFFVMEFVEGRPLRDAIKAEGMDFEQVAQLIRQIGHALTAVHKQKVFRRDLKPENIVLQDLGDGEEHAKLIDFGIVKVKDSDVGPETTHPMLAGTIPYLAPEQLNGYPITAATDIYTFGVIAYEMLTGRRPFNTTAQDPRVALQQLVTLQQGGLRLGPRDLREDLPETAGEAIHKALSLDPVQRHIRAKDFGDALAIALTTNASQTSPHSTQPPKEAIDSNAPTLPQPQENKSEQSGKRRIVIAGAVAILAVIVAVVVWKLVLASKPAPANLPTNSSEITPIESSRPAGSKPPQTTDSSEANKGRYYGQVIRKDGAVENYISIRIGYDSRRFDIAKDIDGNDIRNISTDEVSRIDVIGPSMRIKDGIYIRNLWAEARITLRSDRILEVFSLMR